MTDGGTWRRTAPERGDPVTIVVDGTPVPAFLGETVAAAMLVAASAFDRDSSGAARTPFCNMGTCFECVGVVDGRAATRTCLVPVRDGLTVETRMRL